jgi:hypothetical protein
MTNQEANEQKSIRKHQADFAKYLTIHYDYIEALDALKIGKDYNLSPRHSLEVWRLVYSD